MDWHINHLEIMAVILAFREFRAELKGHHVLVRLDNSTVVALVNHQEVSGLTLCTDW